MPPVHYVYMLRSDTDDGLYIGYSANLRKRMAQHGEGLSKATARRRPWRLIYYEAYLDQADAVGRERYLKSGGGRRFLKAQLSNYLKNNPVKLTA
jgi:putative endonuclease